MNLEANRQRLFELKPEAQWAALAWLDRCAFLNLNFKIVEVYRSQTRQNALYAKGRTTKGPIVTWTKSSMHTKRLAADIVPENCTYEQIQAIAVSYGIYRPKDLIKLGDKGHFQMDSAKQPPKAGNSLQRAADRLNRILVGAVSKANIERLQARLKKILGFQEFKRQKAKNST